MQCTVYSKWFGSDIFLSLLSLLSVSPLKKKKKNSSSSRNSSSGRDGFKMIIYWNNSMDNTSQVKISTPHPKCTALKCTTLKSTNRSMRFRTHIVCVRARVCWGKLLVILACLAKSSRTQRARFFYTQRESTIQHVESSPINYNQGLAAQVVGFLLQF